MLDEDSVDKTVHERDTKTGTGRIQGGLRLAPAATVAHLDTQCIRLGPDGQLDRTRVAWFVSVLDRIGGGFVDGEHSLVLPLR
jgi:hypothetical protein